VCRVRCRNRPVPLRTAGGVFGNTGTDQGAVVPALSARPERTAPATNRSVDRTQVNQPVVTEQVEVVHREREPEGDDRNHDGGRPRPPLSAPDAEPGQRHDADADRDQQPGDRHVQVVDVVCHLRVRRRQLSAGDPAERVDPQLEAGAEERPEKEDEPVPDEPEPGNRHQDRTAGEAASRLVDAAVGFCCGLF
jgi:hypothetical protein